MKTKKRSDVRIVSDAPWIDCWLVVIRGRGVVGTVRKIFDRAYIVTDKRGYALTRTTSAKRAKEFARGTEPKSFGVPAPWNRKRRTR